MAAIIQWSLVLWIITHSAAEFFGSFGARKPLSCQKCLAGWCTIIAAVGSIVWIWTGELMWLDLLTAWALSVLIEAVYSRLNLMIL